MRVGLRIDVDTFRGTRYGVPNLCSLLAKHSIKATFFFSVGPDNMGRHLWRLVRPAFFWKMLRTGAPGLYGWDIILRGTFWQGPVIGEKLSGIIKKTSDDGHEIGLHAWDHHAWQSNIDKMDKDSISHSINQGVEMLTKILGKPPICSAAPGWRCNDQVLLSKSDFPFVYNSDCRGKSIFYPLVNGVKLSPLQIPVTLPTYDEVIGQGRITNSNYNEYILSLLSPDRLNVLTIHAEVEGIVCSEMFAQFLEMAHKKKVSFVPLGELFDPSARIDCSEIAAKYIPGREGKVACQKVINR